MATVRKKKVTDDADLLVNSRLSSSLEQLLVGMGASLEPEREKDELTVKAEKSFTEFFKQAWPIMEPGVPYIHGWHIDAICEHLEAVSRGEIHKLLINMPPRHAKLCSDDTDVLTPDGWKKHGDLRVGDKVYSPEGRAIRVVAVAPKFIATHRVTFTDGAFVDVNLEHEWTVYDRTDRQWKTLETVDFVRSRRSKHKPAKLFYGDVGKRGCHYRYQLPWVDAQEFAEVEHKVHPYCLGIWLGDGTATASTITMSQEDAAIVKPEFNRLGVPVGKCWIHATTGVESFSLADGDVNSERHGFFRCWLRENDLFNNKHIPQGYLFDSIENRKELLAGLLDSDGYMDAVSGRVRYVTTNLRLAEDVVALVRSLGGVATISARDPKPEEEQREYYEARGMEPVVSRLRVYSVSFVQPFKINSRLKRRQSDVEAKKFRRSVKSVVELTEPKQGNCIQVETEDGLYLVSKDLVPTHNSTICSVAFPAWEWIHRPWMKYLYSSYSGALSIRDSVACRRLITSGWYQANWGNLYSLTDDQNVKMRFENSQHGIRLATSVGGTTTGEGGDRIVCFPYEAKVLTEYGPMQIGEIVEQRRDMRVWCLDGNGKPCLRSIERWNRNPGRPIVRVHTSDGGTFECTADHRIRTSEGWKEAGKLTARDMLPRFAVSDVQDGGFVNAEMPCKCAGGLGGLQDKPDILLSELAPGNFMTLGTVGVLSGDGVVSSGSSASDEGNVSRSYAEAFCKVRSGFAGLADICNVSFRKSGVGRFFAGFQSLGTDSIGHIVRARAVGKILDTIIRGIAVQVTYVKAFWLGAEKRLCHKLVDEPVMRSPIPAETDASVPPMRCGFEDFTRNSEGQTVAQHDARHAFDESGLGNLIKPSKTGNVVPICTEVNVAHPEATYCLTVRDHHNFMVETVNENYIVVANCDDPHNVKEAESETVRQGVLDWWHQAMSTRLNDPKRGAYIVVMQRVHDQDLSGSILERGGYYHLMLPCRYEGQRTHWTIGWQDPRTKEGELLWPERFDEQHVSELEKTLGSYAAAAQLQQRPTPAEGGIFKQKWFRTYENRPSFIRIIESWDTATSEKELSAYSVCTVWGETVDGDVYLLHVDRQRLTFPQLKAQVVAIHQRFNGHGILIEDKSSGRQLCQDIGQGTRLPIIPVQVVKGQDKVSRAMGCSPMIEAGRVYIPANASWLSVFMQEVLTFPNSQYKDQVDSMTQALNYLRGGTVTSAMDFS